MKYQKRELSPLQPFRLLPWFSKRVWGRLDLRPWYGSPGTLDPIGEAWLTGPECVVETGTLAGRTLASVVADVGESLGGAEFPLLVKMLFPNDKLSVQVHPDDAQAQSMGYARGKTECWYVLEAKSGATVALGLRKGVTAVGVAEAVADGSLEGLLVHIPVSVGDMVFVDAGTVHAIGAGVVLLETQQTSDVTFRLYDYGRPRELHLQQALRVMKTQTAAGKIMPKAMNGFMRLIEQQYFIVDRYEVTADRKAVVAVDEASCLVGLEGTALVEGVAVESVELLQGQAVVLPAGSGSLRVQSHGNASFLRCFAPATKG